MRKKISTTVYLEESQQIRLKELSERTRVPVAEYIREGVELVLNRYDDKLPGQLSLGFGDPSKGADS